MQNDYAPDGNPLSDPGNLDLKTATLELTHRDNLYNMKSAISEPVKDELGTGEWINVIDKLDNAGFESVTFIGGEPTVKEDFTDILGYAVNTIGDVTVQTNGTTPVKLSSYRCTVAIEMIDARSKYHNQVFRVTDPSEFGFDRDNERLVMRNGGECVFCGKDMKKSGGFIKHLKSDHADEAVKRLNDKVDAGVSDWDEALSFVKGSDRLDSGFFLKKGFDLDDMEFAQARAFQKANNLAKSDTPIILKSTIFENNDVESIISMAEVLGASTIFTPLKPVGRAKNNFLDQVPSPGRMLEVMKRVNTANAMLSTSHTIDTPMYDAFLWKNARNSISASDKQGLSMKYGLEDELERFWSRGRLDDTGVSHINVLPDGSVTPSHYIRHSVVGNILSDSISDIRQGLADWNKQVHTPEFHTALKGTDLRSKSIASDLDIVLNYPYK